jgi:hypothetical protein
MCTDSIFKTLVTPDAYFADCLTRDSVRIPVLFTGIPVFSVNNVYCIILSPFVVRKLGQLLHFIDGVTYILSAVPIAECLFLC